MGVVWTAYVTAALVTVPVQGLLGYWIYTRYGDVRGSRWFAATLLLGVVWVSFHVVMLISTDTLIQWAAWTVAEKTAIASFVTWIVFSSRYSGMDFHRHWLAKVGLGYLTATVLLPSFLDPFSDLLYERRLVVTEPFKYVTVEPGIGYVLGLVVIVVLAGVGYYALVKYLLSTPRNSGTQLVLLVLGGLAIPLLTVGGKVGLFPAAQLNHATYGMLPFSLFLTVAFFRFRLFEIQPVARNAVVEELRDPVFVLDPDRKLSDYNQAASKMVPAVTDGVGRPLSDIHPELAESLVFPEDDGKAATEISLDVSGRTRHYSVNVSRVGGENDTSADWYSVVLRDVTELEQSRRQLKAQNERLDQVAGTISHDLRNPIQVAVGSTVQLCDRLESLEVDPVEREKALDAVETTQDSLGRMEDILGDLLTIAREGKVVDDTDLVSLRAVAEDAWRTVDTGGASLTVRADRDLYADRSKLRSIFENLFRNSVEHGPDDVTVTVGPDEDGFYVSDDGPGIDASEVAEVFEYGYTTSDEGTGLGLSIVRTMAQSHGWSVRVADDDGGARFVFENVQVATAERPAGE